MLARAVQVVWNRIRRARLLIHGDGYRRLSSSNSDHSDQLTESGDEGWI